MEQVDKYGIDFEKPLFGQVWKVGKDYEIWVHKPSMKKTFRMFHSDFVETFSSTPWYVVPSFWIPVIFWMAVTSMNLFPQKEEQGINSSSTFVPSSIESGCTKYEFISCFLYGLAMWTILEYLLHRFVFHTPVDGNSAFLVTTHFLLHGQHHKFPMDKGRLVFPVVPAVILCGVIWICVTRPFFSYHKALAVQCGILIGYVAYDLTHYYTHFGNPTKGYLGKLKKSHMRHHFKDTTHGYGISSEIWDWVFGTEWPLEIKERMKMQ